MADTTPSEPYSRSPSPPPWITPSLALSACPSLDRSASSISGRSASSSRSVSDGGTSRRRGYMRPQATVFAASAKNRDSVMSLGSIAHLQYYFARTGLLDGKGGQLAKTRKTSGGAGGSKGEGAANGYASRYSLSPAEKDTTCGIPLDDSHAIPLDSPSPYADDESAIWEGGEETEPVMLPPTVSTYLQRPVYVAPPPNMRVLRRELREGLEEAERVLLETGRGGSSGVPGSGTTTEAENGDEESQGWHEIEGLHVLDTVTLAIRAARNYYTAHEQPQRLYAIKSERLIRSELYQTLDVLKRMATRNFAGGIRQAEREGILGWIAGIGELLDADEERERAEEQEREKWSWREGDWTGREREREWLFLKSFDPTPEPDLLPRWTEPSESNGLPTPFLGPLRSGLRLVRLHNALVRKSRRQFEEIRVFHTDTAKPYRCAENLRFWIKAAELRWEVKLDVDVMGVVQGADEAAWRGFEEAVLVWSRAVRAEMTREWAEQREASKRGMPTLRIDTHSDELEETAPILSPTIV